MLWATFFLSAAVPAALAIGGPACVSFTSSANSFPLVSHGKAASILISPDEYPGVQRAAQDFASDVHKVTGASPTLTNSTKYHGSAPLVIVGTLGHSSLIDSVLNASHSLASEVSSLRGQWESYSTQLVQNPLPGVSSALVIIGSDKRGTIYALYEYSQQSGVSPWYYWADVPIQRHDNLFLLGCKAATPSVKYRGIFLNDEQPALQSWAQKTFTNGTGPAFNHVFYQKVFELLLRLKANYLWPAIWSSQFAIDDALTQPLADTWGIVLGTSHQEPMARTTPNEWSMFGHGDWNFTTNSQNITNFWIDGVKRARPYETVYTLGMRGSGDLPLEESTNVNLLEAVVADQRQILSQVYNQTDASGIPQMWCLYKEVQGYYEDGMRVPDDVILLWADDNWGNIRRLPLESERNRTGGAGVYYHFDYVGTPRDYKWIGTTQISKIYEQMNLAYTRAADKMWIVNVGDLKPYELDIEFFLTLGYNVNQFTPDNLDNYVAQWATREFGAPQHSAQIASIVANFTRYNARSKPELLNSTTYSLTDYREAETVVADWKLLYDETTAIYKSLPEATRPAFFQLVLHPVQASYQVQNLYTTAGKNNLYASQARLSTNDLADQALALFEADYDLENQYHTMLGGKWDHMMDQTHLGYYYWQQPMQNTMPAVTRVQAKKQALPGAMRIAIEGSRGAWPGDNPYQCALGYNCPPPALPTLDPYLPKGSRWLDISAGGPNSFTFSVSSNVSWLTITPNHGSISTTHPDQRLEFSADWSHTPSGASVAAITLNATTANQPDMSVIVYVTANKTQVASGFKGFVEGDGGVSIEASHTARNSSAQNTTWTVLPNYGRTLAGVTPLPALGNANFSIGSGPSLEYDFYTFNSVGGNVTLHSYLSPSMNANGADRPLAFAVQIDGETPQQVKYVAPAASGALPPGWDADNGPLAESIVQVSTVHVVGPGNHTLKVWAIEQAVVVQKFVVDTGGVRPSYLGPPESVRV